LENVQILQSWVHKAASSIIANPSKRIYSHIRKGDDKCPPPQIFPDDSTAQDSGKLRNIRAQTAELGPPDPQINPKFPEHEVDEVVRNIDDSKCPCPNGIDGIIVNRLYKCLPKF
jgi:hypothetical protein